MAAPGASCTGLLPGSRRMFWLWPAVVSVLLVIAEVAARTYGLGSPLLYEKTGYGYRVKPDQSLSRFGNRLSYNRQGLRSEPKADVPAPGKLRILCVGDSITFGGAETTQDLTYPYLLEKMLNSQSPADRYEVLNASAGGWAMENEEGWLGRHGIYSSRFVVLQVASHDLFQAAADSGIVGTHPAFPERPPWFALQELFVRYILPRLWKNLRLRDPGEVLHQRTAADITRTLGSLRRIAAMVRSQGGELVVMLVEQPQGIEPRDELMQQAKKMLQAQLAADGISLLQPGEAIERAGGALLFRDGLHPNVGGNHVLAQTVAAEIQRTAVGDAKAQRLSTRTIRAEAGAR